MIEKRPLSYMEKFATGWMSPIAHFTFSGPFTQQLIMEAMQQVRWSHPLLRCTIENGDIVTVSAHASLKETLPIVVHHCNQGDDDRFQQAAACAYERLGLNMVPRNLWQMRFFYSDDGCEMVFQIHHSLFDGMSWFSIARDFLAACEGERLKIRPLNLGLETIYPDHARATHSKEPFCVKEWFEITQLEPETYPIFTGSVLARLSQEVVIALRARCKAHSVTVHAALMAAYLMATDNELPKIYTDVSTRKWCNPALDPISPGVYNGQVVWATHADKRQSFWENASRMIGQLHALIEKGAHFSSSDECSSTSIGPQITCITNMAPPELPRGTFALDFSTVELVTGLTSEIPSFPIIFSIMTSNRVANLRLHYHQHFWSADHAEHILKKIVHILTEEGAGLEADNVSIFSQPQNSWK